MVGYQGHVPRARHGGYLPAGQGAWHAGVPTGKVGIDMEEMMNGNMVRILQPPGSTSSSSTLPARGPHDVHVGGSRSAEHDQ